MLKTRPAAVSRTGAALLALAVLGAVAAPAGAAVDGWWSDEGTGTGSLTIELANAPEAGAYHDILAWSPVASRQSILTAPDTTVLWQQGSPFGAPGLPAAAYTIGANVHSPDSIYAPGYITENGWVPQTGIYEGPKVTLADGEAKTIRVSIPVGGTAKFTIVDPQGIPVEADIRMWGTEWSQERHATSNDKGEILVHGLNTERYSFIADINGAHYYPAPNGSRLSSDPNTVGSRGVVLGQESDLGTFVVDNPFTDVWHDNLFAREIVFMKFRGITTGYDDGSFRPLTSVNRDAMAAYLYRLAGSPTYTAPSRSPFTDVATNNKFYKEIAWLASTNITTGYGPVGARQFRPLEPVARDAMAAFIYRFVERFGARGDHPRLFITPTTSPFSDVSTGQQFFREMAWLKDSGISTGWSDGSYRSLSHVNRDAMSAFIYRTDLTFLD